MRRMDELHLEFPFGGNQVCATPSETRSSPSAEDGFVAIGSSPMVGIEAAVSLRCPVPLSAPRPEPRTPQSRLGDRYHLHPDAQGLRVSAHHPRLA